MEPHGPPAAPGALAVARALHDAFNRRDEGLLRQLASEDLKVVDTAFALVYRGKGGLVQLAERWTVAFRDARIEIVGVVSVASRAAVEGVVRGTHTGPFEGPDGIWRPTGRTLELPICDVLHVQAGEIMALQRYFDRASLIRQLTAR